MGVGEEGRTAAAATKTTDDAEEEPRVAEEKETLFIEDERRAALVQIEEEFEFVAEQRPELGGEKEREVLPGEGQRVAFPSLVVEELDDKAKEEKGGSEENATGEAFDEDEEIRR